MSNPEMGWLDADAILAYDAARSTPAATPEIETAIRAIAEKPHLAPLILEGLLRPEVVPPDRLRGKAVHWTVIDDDSLWPEPSGDEQAEGTTPGRDG